LRSFSNLDLSDEIDPSGHSGEKERRAFGFFARIDLDWSRFEKERTHWLMESDFWCFIMSRWQLWHYLMQKSAGTCWVHTVSAQHLSVNQSIK